MNGSDRDAPPPRRAHAALALAVSLAAASLACGPRDPVAIGHEVCNGVDDDGNGIVDDLDANGDGLCDCLRIGVLGYPGQAGSGDVIRGWLHGRAVPTAILAGAALTPELLGGLDVLLVQDVQDGVATGTVGREGIGIGIGRTFSDAEVQALRAWVDAGGGLMALSGFTGNTGENTNVNRLLAPFGLSYGSQRILVGQGTPVPVTHWNATHPLASGVAQVGVDGAYAVQGGGTLVAWEPAPGAYDLGRALESGRGHVFAWGDEWIEYDAEWTSQATSQVLRLWLDAFKWLTPAGVCQVPLPG